MSNTLMNTYSDRLFSIFVFRYHPYKDQQLQLLFLYSGVVVSVNWTPGVLLLPANFLYVIYLAIPVNISPTLVAFLAEVS